jgi:hypothetical protein
MIRTRDQETNRTPLSTPVVVFELALAAVGAAVLPVVAGVAILMALWLRPRLLDRFLCQLQCDRRIIDRGSGATPAMLRAGWVWGMGFLLLGAVQGTGAVWFDLSITSPAGFALRTLVALTGEVLLGGGTFVYMRRTALTSRAGTSTSP